MKLVIEGIGKKSENWTVADIEKILKKNINRNKKYEVEIENGKIYFYIDGFSRKEVELLYTHEEYLKLKK